MFEQPNLKKSESAEEKDDYERIKKLARTLLLSVGLLMGRAEISMAKEPKLEQIQKDVEKISVLVKENPDRTIRYGGTWINSEKGTSYEKSFWGGRVEVNNLGLFITDKVLNKEGDKVEGIHYYFDRYKDGKLDAVAFLNGDMPLDFQNWDDEILEDFLSTSNFESLKTKAGLAAKNPSRSSLEKRSIVKVDHDESSVFSVNFDSGKAKKFTGNEAKEVINNLQFAYSQQLKSILPETK